MLLSLPSLPQADAYERIPAIRFVLWLPTDRPLEDDERLEMLAGVVTLVIRL